MKITNTDENGPNNSQSRSDSRQSFQEASCSSLDAVCRTSEETYDEFMKGFLYLRPENVQKTPAADNEGPPAEFLQFMESQKLKSKTASRHLEAAKSVCSTVEAPTPDIPAIAVKPQTNESTLDEETLGAGTTTRSYLMRSDVTSRSMKVKVGNFMDDEHSDSDEDMYCPSFTTKAQEDTSKDPLPQGHCTNTVDVKQQDSPFSTSSQQPEVTCQEVEGKSILLNTTSSADKILPSANLSEHSDKTDTETRLSSQLDYSESSVQKAYPAQSTEADDLLDLVGDYNSEQDDSELVYDPSKDKLNFGEVEEDNSDSEANTLVEMQRLKKDTLLEFKVVQSTSKSEEEESQTSTSNSECRDTVQSETKGEESCSDEVQSFVLDTDFDYDNVTLTPKYSAEEMAIIAKLASASNVN